MNPLCSPPPPISMNGLSCCLKICAEKFRVPSKVVLKWLSCEKFLWRNLRQYLPPSKKFSCRQRYLKIISELWKTFCENLCPYPLEILFACRQRGAKMTELRKFSVKTSVPIIPLEKISRADKVGLNKMAELRKNFSKNLRPYPVDNFFAYRQKGVLKDWVSKFFMKNISPYHPPSKKFSRADKGGLKMPELRKISVKTFVSTTSEIFSRVDKGEWKNKMTELRKNCVKSSVPILSLEKFSSADKEDLKLSKLWKNFFEKPPSLPLEKNVRVPTNGVLKWLSCENFP